MSKRRILVLLAALVSLPASAGATGFYFGGGLGNDVEGGSFRAGLEDVSESRGDRSKLFAGVEIGRYFAVEAARYDFGRQTCCRFFADLGFTSEVDGTSVAALGRWPMRWATPFVKAGILSWQEDGRFVTLLGSSPRSADGEDLLMGAGVDIKLVSVLRLRVEWERYEFDDLSTDGVWGSVVLAFGGQQR